MALALVEVASIGSEDVVTLHGDFKQLAYPPAGPEAVRFRQLRKELGFTLADAADVLGIGVAAVSDLEHGCKTCDWKEAEQLLRYARVREKE